MNVVDRIELVERLVMERYALRVQKQAVDCQSSHTFDLLCIGLLRDAMEKTGAQISESNMYLTARALAFDSPEYQAMVSESDRLEGEIVRLDAKLEKHRSTVTLDLWHSPGCEPAP